MKPLSDRLSYNCLARSLFLGLPIIWLMVAACMMVSLTMENVRNQRQDSSGIADDLHKGHGHAKSAKDSMESDHVLSRKIPSDMSAGRDEHRQNDLRFHKNKKRIGNEIKDSDLKHNDVVKMNANRFDDKDRAKTGQNPDNPEIQRPHHEDERESKVVDEDKKTVEKQVVDVSDLAQFAELRRLAPILKPATDNNAPGENGRPVQIVKEKLSPSERTEFDHGWKVNSFNQFASDQISVHRTLQNNLSPLCADVKYPPLPDTSVIICFHNEALSVLLRTVHSVFNRSPAHLIKEIILVDDFSDQDHLKGPLDAYVNRLDKVRLVRTVRREGLIKARLLGYSHATGTVLTFLDSHCECSEGWLEPLLGPIAENPHTITSPVIDSISDQTMSYIPGGHSLGNVMIGTFDWDLLFHWKPLPEREKQRRQSLVEAIRTPTIAGGLFSVSREYFTYLGTYDAGMKIWGGENLEISFRTWMCGGRLLIMPCSHVGHIFRKTSPYNKLPGENVLQRNSMRVAMVWLDEYKQYYLERFIADMVRYGDISDRVALRKRLNCTSFRWYLENVYLEMYVPSDTTAAGEIYNTGAQICLEWNKKSPAGPIRTFQCHGQGGNQFWLMTKDNRIKMDDLCVGSLNGAVHVNRCNENNKSQHWLYKQDGSLYNMEAEKCMDFQKSVVLAECSKTKTQNWYWKRRKNTTAVQT